jgi:hypothetical protein
VRRRVESAKAIEATNARELGLHAKPSSNVSPDIPTQLDVVNNRLAPLGVFGQKDWREIYGLPRIRRSGRYQNVSYVFK